MIKIASISGSLNKKLLIANLSSLLPASCYHGQPGPHNILPPKQNADQHPEHKTEAGIKTKIPCFIPTFLEQLWYFVPKPAVFTYYNKHYQLLQEGSRSFFLTRNNKAGVSGARGLTLFLYSSSSLSDKHKKTESHS